MLERGYPFSLIPDIHVRLSFRIDDSRTSISVSPQPLDRIHRKLKREFDPAGIFNRGRMYPDF